MHEIGTYVYIHTYVRTYVHTYVHTYSYLKYSGKYMYHQPELHFTYIVRIRV